MKRLCFLFLLVWPLTALPQTFFLNSSNASSNSGPYVGNGAGLTNLYAPGTNDTLRADANGKISGSVVTNFTRHWQVVGGTAASCTSEVGDIAVTEGKYLITIFVAQTNFTLNAGGGTANFTIFTRTRTGPGLDPGEYSILQGINPGIS